MTDRADVGPANDGNVSIAAVHSVNVDEWLASFGRSSGRRAACTVFRRRPSMHHLPLLPRPPGDIVLNARRTALAMIVSGQVEVAKVLVRTQASGPSTDRYDHRILSRTHERVRHPPAMNTEIEPLNGEQHKRQRRPQA